MIYENTREAQQCCQELEEIRTDKYSDCAGSVWSNLCYYSVRSHVEGMTKHGV